MGIRQKLAENRGLGVGVAILLLIGGAIVIGYQMRALGPPPSTTPQAFYTNDDGKTLFVAPSDSLPPFDHGGKPAVRAYVYKCSGQQFVGYLERYTDEAKRMVRELDEAVKNAKPGGQPPANLGQLVNARRFGREVKRPGDKNWVSVGSREGGRAIDVQCPPGIVGTPELVLPD